MHERRIRIGESHYDYYSHSGREGIVRYRDLTERWLVNYPQEHRTAWLKRFRNKKADSHESAFFELFLHEYVHRFCDHVEIEGTIPDSKKQADFVLHFGDGTSLAIEALSLRPTGGIISENIHRVNEYVRQVMSSDFSIWFGESQGRLDQTPPKRVVQSWAERVLARYRWEDAIDVFERTGEMCFPVEPLRLENWIVEAQVCVRPGDNREERECLGVLAGGGGGYYEAPGAARKKILSKIRAKKSLQTEVPFFLAVNVADWMMKPGEEELEILHGFKHKVHITPVKRDDGTIDYPGQGLFSPDGTEGVWSTADNESKYGRCSAMWFFHRVHAAHPTGTRQAMYLNPYTDHDFRTLTMLHYSTAGVGMPE